LLVVVRVLLCVGVLVVVGFSVSVTVFVSVMVLVSVFVMVLVRVTFLVTVLVIVVFLVRVFVTGTMIFLVVVTVVVSGLICVCDRCIWWDSAAPAAADMAMTMAARAIMADLGSKTLPIESGGKRILAGDGSQELLEIYPQNVA